ncbi:MAG: hypothetical protein ACYSWU_20710 [Planctomycetota bacterium]|jgi:hypothetical protein
MENVDFSKLALNASGRSLNAEDRQKVPDLVKKIDELICIDEPLPVHEISRYLAQICLVGIERTPGWSSKRYWVETMTRVLKTCNSIDEQKTGKSDERRLQVLGKLWDAASKRMELEDIREHDQADEGKARSA